VDEGALCLSSSQHDSGVTNYLLGYQAMRVKKIGRIVPARGQAQGPLIPHDYSQSQSGLSFWAQRRISVWRARFFAALRMTAQY